MTPEWTDELERLREQDLLRRISVLSRTDGGHVELDGRRLVNFASNDYLGLAMHPEVVRAAKEALDVFGLGAGASRLMSGTFSPCDELEHDLARWKRAESALVFSSGYLANLGLLATLPGPSDVVFLDRLCHASLVDAARLGRGTLRVFAHNDVEDLARHLERWSGTHRRFLVTEGVFSMDGDRAPLVELVELARRTDSWLVVDDAHGLGCLGPTGAGLMEELGIEPTERVIQVGTLSKAVGALGGFVAGTRTLREWLVNRARPFIYTTALPPAVCVGAIKALELLRSGKELRERLWGNVTRLRERLADLGLDTGQSGSQIVPVILGDPGRATEWSGRCLEAGLYVPAVRPPTVPAGSSRLRISVTAMHNQQEIDMLAEALKDLRTRS